MTFAEKLKSMRKQSGMSQEKLAEKIGVSRQAITKWENNSGPCENKGTCVSFRLWEKLDTAINEVLESITLGDMLDWQNELLADQYVI